MKLILTNEPKILNFRQGSVKRVVTLIESWIVTLSVLASFLFKP